MRILFLRHRRIWRSSRGRRYVDQCSGSERISRIDYNFIGRSNALDDFDRGAEIATDFDVVKFNAVIGFHDSDL